MNAKIIFLFAVAFTLAGSACTKSSSSTAPAPPINVMAPGTSSSGGGNGIDNKSIEGWHINIESRPEYQDYVVPMLKKMEMESPDVMVVYLEWAARHKSWYMIPDQLEKLPSDRIAVAFPTEQVALQSDTEIFISSPVYDPMTEIEKARLIVHEMVMGTKLLMKKMPADQCRFLDRASISACSDPDMMKLAKAPSNDPSQSSIISDDDIGPIRSMTGYLTDSSNDLSGPSILSERRALDFSFPWDQATSSLSMSDVQKIIMGEAYGNSNFKFVDKIDKAPRCIFDLNGLDATGYIFLSLYSVPEDGGISTPKNGPYGMFSLSRNNEWGGNTILRFFSEQFSVFTSSNLFNARGGIYPEDGKQVVDVVKFTPSTAAADGQPADYMTFYISRDQTPRILEIVVDHRRLIAKVPGSKSNQIGDYDSVERADDPPSKCQLVP